MFDQIDPPPDASEADLHENAENIQALRASKDRNGLMGITENISETKPIEAQLREFNSDFVTFLENTGDFVYFKDKNCRIRFCSQTLADITGHRSWRDMIGKHALEIFPTEMARIYDEEDQQILTEGNVLLDKIAPYYDAQGVLRWVSTKKWPVFGEDKKTVAGIFGISRDITERKRMDEALREREEAVAMREREFRTLAENSPDDIARYDCTGHTLYVNPAFEHTVGQPAQSLLGRTPLESVPGELFAAYQQAILQVAATGENASIEQTIPARTGRPQIHSISLVAEKGPDGIPFDVLAIGHDISKMKWAEENLRITAGVFDSSQEGIVITDADANVLDVNPAFTNITGYTRAEVIGKNARLLSSGRHDKAFYLELWHALERQRSWRGEIWNRRKSGEVYTELLSIATICDDHGTVQRYVGVFSDISYLKTHEAELSQFANYDALTGIPNRRLLGDRMTQAIARAKRYGKMLAVCLIDLDGFKQVNDQYGHEAGDTLLIEVAHRLLAVLRAEDTLARLGGDEFVVLFNDLAGMAECTQILDRILDMITMPISIDSHMLTISASIGLTFYTSDDEDGGALLRRADRAMYIAKHDGKGRYHLFDAQRD